MTGATIDSTARRRLGVGAAIVLVLVAVAAAVVVGVVRTSATPQPETETVAAASGALAPPPVYVHVSGAVVRPGLYRLDEGARVVDAVAAAGGMTADADEGAVNLARRLADGEQLRLPALGEAVSEPVAAGVAPDGRVNLNTADASVLDTLPRIGPALAQRIVEWRAQHGAFTSVDDLRAVPGIGEKMLASLRERVTV